MDKLSKQVLTYLGATMIVLSLMGCDRLLSPQGNMVERVSDGDTLVLKDGDGKNLTVRFACIDAAEVPHSKRERNSELTRDLNQFGWGVKAQERVKQLVQQSDNQVNLTIVDSDRYGRKVAEVRLKDGTFLQQVLLQEGLAKVYRNSLDKCPSKDIIQQAEAQARKQEAGVWGDGKFVNPWEYRKSNKYGTNQD